MNQLLVSAVEKELYDCYSYFIPADDDYDEFEELNKQLDAFEARQKGKEGFIPFNPDEDDAEYLRYHDDCEPTEKSTNLKYDEVKLEEREKKSEAKDAFVIGDKFEMLDNIGFFTLKNFMDDYPDKDEWIECNETPSNAVPEYKVLVPNRESSGMKVCKISINNKLQLSNVRPDDENLKTVRLDQHYSSLFSSNGDFTSDYVNRLGGNICFQLSDPKFKIRASIKEEKFSKFLKYFDCQWKMLILTEMKGIGFDFDTSHCKNKNCKYCNYSTMLTTLTVKDYFNIRGLKYDVGDEIVKPTSNEKNLENVQLKTWYPGRNVENKINYNRMSTKIVRGQPHKPHEPRGLYRNTATFGKSKYSWYNNKVPEEQLPVRNGRRMPTEK